MSEPINGQSGALSVASRLDRIDNTLVRIEDKLDTKAGVDVVSSIDSRVRNIELTGSKTAATALAAADALAGRVASMELKTATYAAVQEGLSTSKANARRLIYLAAGVILSALGLIANTVFQILHR